MSALKDLLKDQINAYLQRNRSEATLLSLSRACGVSYSTIRRYAGGDSQEPNVQHAVAILKTILKPKIFYEVLEKLAPDFYENLLPLKDHQIEEDESNFEKLNQVVESSIKNIVFHICATRSGSCREKIRDSYGKEGLKAVEELLEAKLLVERDNRLYGFCEWFFMDHPNTVKRACTSLLDNFKNENLGQVARLGIRSESLNEQGVLECKKAATNFISKISRIMNKDEFAGPIPYWAVVAANSFEVLKLEEQQIE